jgi:predicted MFS family arabinose efflux permease
VAAVGQVLAVPAALLTPLLLTRWSNEQTFARSSLTLALGLLPLALIPHAAAAGLGYAVVIALGSVWRPAFILCKLGAVSPRWQALMNGATNMALGLSMAAMAIGGGYIASGAGYGVLFLVGAAGTAAGAGLFWTRFRGGRTAPLRHPHLERLEQDRRPIGVGTGIDQPVDGTDGVQPDLK